MTAPAPQARHELDPGSTFAGRYQVIEEIGRGGMGRVYKVIDKEIHARIALKLIRPEISSDRATIERFRQELRTAREISHKNICRMYDLGRDGDTYFLTMEYVPGEDLKSMIAMSGQLGVGTAISIAKQVCEGLIEAHRLGIVHRDLKPQNIQIDRGGHARIMDFGIARPPAAKGITDAGVVIGTPQYMSPEQVEAEAVDARSDVYSLGVILYEMLTGRVPFDGDTPLSVAVKQKLERPRDPRELNASIPPDLGQVILKCLEKDRSQRYQSAGEVLADLVRIEQGLPTTEQVVPRQRPSTSREITVHFNLKQLLVPAMVALAIVAAAVGVWRFRPHRAAGSAPPGAKPTLAVLYFENMSGDRALDAWRTGLPELLITGLSQSRFLNVVSSDRIYSVLKKLNLAEAKRYSAEDLSSVAREGGAHFLLTGSVMKAGQSTVITTRLQAATGEVIRSAKAECLTEQEILSKVDELASGIKSDLSSSPQELAADTSEPLDRVLTSSPEALKYYTEARRFHLNNAYQDAIRLYDRAIDADPGFAMAYRGLSACYGNVGDNSRGLGAARKALELSDRLPERLRYQIQVTAYSASEPTYPEAFEACRRLLAKYPDDVIGLSYLANARDVAEEFAESLALREAAAKASETALHVTNLATTYLLLGNPEKAHGVLDAYLQRNPASSAAHVSKGWLHLALGDVDAAQREAEKALLLDPGLMDAVFIKGDVALLRGDFGEAEREYSRILDEGGAADRRNARDALAGLFVGQGRFAQAREQARAGLPGGRSGGMVELACGHPDRAVSMFQALLADPVRVPEGAYALRFKMALGLSHVARGDITSAEKVAADIRTWGGGLFVRPATRLGLVLSGAMALRQGAAGTAIGALEKAVSTLPSQMDAYDEHALVYDLLARAYVAAGDLARARQAYEKIATLTTARLAWGHIYAESFYHLGVMAERQGDMARAREDFRKFLHLWKDADPGLPEVADAKKRLARL